MTTKLCVWGNSLGVRLPKYVAERSGARAGDYLYITVSDDGAIIIRPIKPRDVHPAYAKAGPKGKTQRAAPEEDAPVEEKW